MLKDHSSLDPTVRFISESLFTVSVEISDDWYFTESTRLFLQAIDMKLIKLVSLESHFIKEVVDRVFKVIIVAVRSNGNTNGHHSSLTDVFAIKMHRYLVLLQIVSCDVNDLPTLKIVSECIY